MDTLLNFSLFSKVILKFFIYTMPSINMSQSAGIGALIFDKKGRLLLMYRTANCDVYKNCWFIPCGKMEKDETPRDTILREAKEELSLDIRVIKEVYNKCNERDIREIAYLCEIVGGTPKIMEPQKCKELGYFPLDRPPKGIDRKILEIIRVYKESM